MTFRELFTYRIFTISNLLSLSRILLTPLAGYFMFSSISDPVYNYYSLGILILMVFTDFLDEIVTDDYDILLNAVVGSIGVKVTMKAAVAGKKILLANKETLVMAGDFVMDTVRKNNAELLPVDSEHNSLHRLLLNTSDWKNLILTASGGPFRQYPFEKLGSVSRKEVMNHPTWSMGPKITVDSAGMINKALEIMEAHHLFRLDYQKISAVIHPQSHIHAMIQHHDGTISMHVSRPDMVYPVSWCLYHPEFAPDMLESPPPDIFPDFSFEAINKKRYPGYYLGIEAGAKKGVYPAVFNAANETAVAAFLRGEIEFTSIPGLIEKTLDKVESENFGNTLDDLFEADKFARRTTV